MDSFVDSRKRIKRALAHLHAFSDGWNTAIQEDGYTVAVDTDSGQGHVKAVRDIPMQIDLSMELGEFFYQLRAALDNAIFEAAELQIGNRLAKYEERLYFPIYIKGSTFENSAFCEIPFPDKLKTWIKSIQPYTVYEAVTPIANSWIEGLRILNDCARKDRHRRLHVVAAVVTEMGGRLGIPPTARIKSVTPLVCNLLENETKFLQFFYEGTCPSDEVYVDGNLTIEISVNEIPLRGPKLAAGLSYVMAIATETVDKIESFYV